MTRLEALLIAFGLQGGTIHQIAKLTGCSVGQLLTGQSKSLGPNSAYSQGWFAGRTCSVEFNKEKNFPRYFGKIHFWLGVAEGIQQLKGQQ